MNLYQDIIMDHYRNPRCRGVLASPDIDSGEHNPSCGDSVQVTGIVRDGVLTQCMAVGAGCVISQAAASLYMEYCQGKSLAVIMNYDATGMTTLLGIPLGPTRLKCALLVWYALRHGIEVYEQRVAAQTDL